MLQISVSVIFNLKSEFDQSPPDFMNFKFKLKCSQSPGFVKFKFKLKFDQSPPIL